MIADNIKSYCRYEDDGMILRRSDVGLWVWVDNARDPGMYHHDLAVIEHGIRNYRDR